MTLTSRQIVLTIALLLMAAPLAVVAQQASIARDRVDPFIGTGGHGHTFPGACVPHGLVQLSPDTRPEGIHDWDGASGYHYSDSVIYGFSHTHLSGTGVSDLCDVLLMPMSDQASTHPEDYRSAFRKETERAHAGYYRVHLDGPDVLAELTASQRVGVHRYHFKTGREAHLVLDLDHRDHAQTQRIIRVNDREVVGERRSSSWADDQRLFFCIRTSHPMRPSPNGNGLAAQIAAQNLARDHFTFGDLGGDPLIVKVGISAVSIEGARRNLETEVPHWDFDQVQRAAEAEWDRNLGKIRVQGGTHKEQRIFYTALYHTMIAPCIFNDVDGHYRGMDGEIHHAEHDVYTIFSLWDTFRSLHPLMTLIAPERTRDQIRTMLLHYQHSGRLPVWELWGNETDCMIGYHSVSVIADAYLKGISGFDADLALEAMVASAEEAHFGLDAYLRRGYISSEDEPESVSKTLEYAYDDGCIARMADAMGEPDIARRFRDRSRNWQNLFDPETHFFRPRRNGGFIEPFDPYEVNFHFTEANAWHYGLFVPHDMDRFRDLLGGRAGLTSRLDALFTAEERTTGREQSDITGLIGQYAHGNEPSHNYAYLYNLSSRPMSAEVYVAKIMRELYDDTPDGLAGNEDCGQMSAWYVLSALGFHPICPGQPEYSVVIPLFDTVTVDLGDGRQLVVSSEAMGGSRSHVMSTAWNGKELERYRTIGHGELVRGGTLHFELGPRPGGMPPRSMHEGEAGPSSGPLPAPIIRSPSPAFRDSMRLRISAIPGPWTVMLDDDIKPQEASQRDPGTDLTRTLYRSDSLRAWCEAADGSRGPEVMAHFVRIDGERTIELESTYAPQYAAGGDQALVDGLRGGSDYRTGEWQGYEGRDVLTTVDLGRVRTIRRAGLGVLQDQKSWIWFPEGVEFAFSMNGRKWSTELVEHDIPRTAEGALTMDLWTPPMRMRARYVKVIAHSAGPCPEWHPGNGRPSWIFADEVLFEMD